MSYQRLAIIPAQEILNAMAAGKTEIVIQGERCGLSSIRIQTYHVHGVKCAFEGCQLEGQYFAAERNFNFQTNRPLQDRFHLNLYGKTPSGEEVMITSDHIIPKSKGGSKNDIRNRQPMCGPHNWNVKKDNIL